MVEAERVAHVETLASMLATRGHKALILQGGISATDRRAAVQRLAGSFDGLLIQCAGRVTRAAPGKDTAEVHDYHDQSTPILAASLQRRMPGYRALGFTTTNLP